MVWPMDVGVDVGRLTVAHVLLKRSQGAVVYIDSYL